jgi:cell volume regulation protein A
VLGEDVLGIPFDDEQLAQSVGYTALALILAEGGLTTRWASIRGSLGPASALATLGTCVSFLVTGAGAWLLLDLDLLTSMLLGAVVASTDSAAVFSVLRSVRLPRRVVGILEAESGFNDAPAVLAVVALTASATGLQGQPWWLAVLLAAAALGIGLVVGVAVGWLGAVVLARLATPVSGPFPLAVIAAVGIATGQPTCCTAAGSSPSTWRPWCWATAASRTAAPPAGSRRRWAGSRRSGSSSCSACS